MALALKHLEKRGIKFSDLGNLFDPKHVYTMSTGAAPFPGALSKGSRRSPAFAVTTPRFLHPQKEISRAIADFLNFPAQTVVSGFQLGKAGVEAATGHPKDLKNVLKGIKQTDPIYATVTGHPGKALAEIKKHPGFAALEIGGVGHGLDRAAGSAGRALRVPGTSRTRVPAVLEGTNFAVRRRYPKGVGAKAGTVLKENADRRRAAKLQAQADHVAQTDHEAAAPIYRKARRANPDVVKPHQIRRAIDEQNAANEDIRRENRAHDQHRISKALKPLKRHEQPLVSLVAQSIVKPTRKDVTAYLQEIRAQHGSLDRESQRVANEKTQQQLVRALDAKNINFKAVAKAADDYKKIVDPHQARLVDHQWLTKDQAERATLIPYAVRHMGASHDGERIVGPNGQNLSNDAIRAHMKQHNVSEPAFITHAGLSRGAYNQRPEQTPKMAIRTRTGESTRKGLMDISPEALKANAAKAQGLADAAEGFWKTISQAAVTGKGGRPLVVPYQTASKLVEDMNARGAQKWRVVKLTENRSAAHMEHILSTAHAEGDITPVVQHMLDALNAKEGNGRFAVVPEEVASQLQKHLKSMGTGSLGKVAQVYGQTFRATVLGTSTSWAAGNIIEAVMRSALDRAGIRSYVTGRRVVTRIGGRDEVRVKGVQLRKAVKGIDPKAGQELRVRATGGGHYGMQSRSKIHRSADQFVGTRVEGTAHALEKFWHTRGPKQLAGVWHHWTDLAFGSTRWVERQFQTAMLGKQIRTELLDDHLFKLSHKAIDEAAQGLRDTKTQAEFGRAVDRAYGKYSKFSPELRGLIANYTPFVAWTLNSYRFIFDVLPRDHPVVTASIASLENANAEWRKAHGLDVMMGKGRLPGFLQGTIPLSGGRHLPLNTKTPFGAFANPLETLKGAVLPQFSGIYNAFSGQDWKGAKINGAFGPDATTPQEIKAAVAAFFEGAIPVLGTAQRVAQKGPVALNPLRPYAKSKKKTAATSKNWGPSSGGSFGPSSSGDNWGPSSSWKP